MPSLFGSGDSNAPTEAAQIQSQAAQQAAALQYQMYQEAVQKEQPWVTAGGGALNQLGGLYGLPGYTAQDPTKTLQATPGYQWGLSQGVNAKDLSAASKGLALSGAQQKGLTSWGQNYGLQNAWNPYINQLNTMSGAGQAGAALQGQQGLSTGQTMGQDYMSAAQAQAQGIMSQAALNQANQNAWFNTLGMGLGGIMAGNLFSGQGSVFPIGGSSGGGGGAGQGWGSMFGGGGSAAPSYQMGGYGSTTSFSNSLGGLGSLLDFM